MATKKSTWADDYVPPSENRPELWKAADHVGEMTLFINPRGIGEIDTSFGPAKPAVMDAIIPLTGSQAGLSFTDENGVSVFGNLARNLLEYEGSAYALGIVNQGKAKPGRSAPYILDDVEDEAMRAKAFAWMDENLERNDEGEIVVKADEAAF